MVFGLRVPGSGFRVSCFDFLFQCWGPGFRVQCSGFRD